MPVAAGTTMPSQRQSPHRQRPFRRFCSCAVDTQEVLIRSPVLGGTRALALSQHPDQHYPQRPVLLAVDQELGEGTRLRQAGWCHQSASGDPVFIPHDVEKRGVLTGIDPEPDSQVSDPFPPPPQVTDSARLTLSRWRHGFEPRWDYGTDQGERATSRDRALTVYPTVYPAPQSEVGVVDLFASLYVVTRSRGVVMENTPWRQETLRRLKASCSRTPFRDRTSSSPVRYLTRRKEMRRRLSRTSRRGSTRIGSAGRHNSLSPRCGHLWQSL